MANQQQSILISQTDGDLCTWELITHSDYSILRQFSDDDDFGVQSFDSDLDLDLDDDQEKDLDLDLRDNSTDDEQKDPDLDLDFDVDEYQPDEEEEDPDPDLDLDLDEGVVDQDEKDLDLDFDVDEYHTEEEEEDLDLDRDEGVADQDELDLDLVNNGINEEQFVNNVNLEENLIQYLVNHEDEVYDDSEYEEDDEMDDELVPWELKGLYMRERIKKSGKKSSIKMDKSNRFFRSVRGRYRNVKAF